MLRVNHDNTFLLSTPFLTIPILGTTCCCNVMLFYAGDKRCCVVLYFHTCHIVRKLEVSGNIV